VGIDLVPLPALCRGPAAFWPGAKPAQEASKRPAEAPASPLLEPNILGGNAFSGSACMIVFTSNSLARPTLEAIASIAGSGRASNVGPAAHGRSMDHDRSVRRARTHPRVR
jgi:hypothetical protein